MKGDVLLRHPERHGCTNPPWVTSLLKNPKYPPYRILPADFPETKTSVREGGGMPGEWWDSQFLVPNLSQEIWLAHRTGMSREHHERQVVTRSSHLH